MLRLSLVLATWFGVGFCPVASGNGRDRRCLALGVGIVLGTFWAYAGVTILLSAAGVWAAGKAEAYFQEHDSHKIVIDEVVGTLVALAGLPMTWPVILAAFILFRALDVTKPWPARQIQSWPGGWGIMADDVVVAVYANLLLRLALALHWIG